MKKAMSLIELLVASALLLIIILAIFALDKSSRDFYRSTKRKSEVAAEVNFAIEHMNKHLMQVAGKDAGGFAAQQINPVIVDGAAETVEFYLEPRAGLDFDMSDDSSMRYAYNSTKHSIVFCDDWDRSAFSCIGSELELIKGRVVSADFEPMLTGAAVYGLNLTIDAIYDHSAVADVYDNPDYNLTTGIFFGEYSLS